MQFTEVQNGDIRIRVAIDGQGPLILCVHGWPELWYSWRHQMKYFVEQGYRVAAMDVRGYGGSSCPPEIAAYSMKNLCTDVCAVAQALSDEPVVLFGHDWGAPIVWNTSLWHPDVVRAVAGLSVPYGPAGDVSFLDMAKQLYGDNFFYILYFQAEGIVEKEVEADLRTAIRKIYYSLSGDAPLNDWLKEKPKEAPLLEGLIDPDPFPAWLSEDDLSVYVDAFAKNGFHGPINRYRAINIDVEDSGPIRGKLVTQPACFIAGEKDMCRTMIPGVDLYADPGAGCEDYRGTTFVPGAGHWVQQEAPDDTNKALKLFLDGL